ncbi:hypothetical protein GALL_367930 [mine drainage metagenome]|uniref:Uncharacterized protein n=1 Tax=mine drainage metagenome TaxID=410659 RepID=A0A1J5QCS6_9ZZZZ
MSVHGSSAFERTDDRGAPSLAERASITVIVPGLLLASKPAACSHRCHHSAILRETIMIRFYFHPPPNPAKIALFPSNSPPSHA